MDRLHNNKSDFGIRDYFLFYFENYGIVKDKQLYKKIIQDFNEELIELIIEESLDYKIPYLNFEVTIRKEKRKPRIVNGKLINTTPPDWKTTKELWDKDPEAKDKKIIVRYNNYHTSGYVFRIYLKKFKSNIKYKKLYKFKPNRDKFSRRLAKRLLDKDKDNLNSFLLY